MTAQARDSQETLKAISARISAALTLLEHNEQSGAMSILNSLKSILPTPDERHIESAVDRVFRSES